MTNFSILFMYLVYSAKSSAQQGFMRQQPGPGARRISVQTIRNRVRASGFSSRKPAQSLSFPNVTGLLGASFVHDTADGIDSNGHESSSLVKGGWTHLSMASQRRETLRTYCPTNNGIQRWKCYDMGRY